MTATPARRRRRSTAGAQERPAGAETQNRPVPAEAGAPPGPPPGDPRLPAGPPPGDPRLPSGPPPAPRERPAARGSRSARSRKRRAPRDPREEGRDLSWLEERGLSRRQRLLVVAGGTVAGVVAAAAAFMMFVTSIGGDYTPDREAASAIGTRPRPDAYRGWPSPKQFAPIAQRTADPEPLTVKEVFAEKTLKEGRITLKLAGTDAGADCAAAVWGRELADQLAQGGCSQVARGVYTSADGRYVAQYTLFNLRDAASADALVASLTTLHRGGWPLALESATAAFPPGGHTEASGHAMGHYAGLVWIGRTDGAEPDAKDDFVSLALAVRDAEKAVFRRVVAASPTAAPTP
ncbi:hypothetical protein GCM10010156_10210 [Planobispora rosea]|uniref:Uncharacterized protein n=1 Tax=Planobispora rosea TaxID=35762 RepID=A0A8J3WBA3_PLARO|nr:hypothetical protein [Planobispora rosea]GGS53509.1 hypothetical protein GCM10010156_10210 [Planobispora rosea]GIH82622.1 hypothetical protein Pro02_10300 [Planobispora rosea]